MDVLPACFSQILKDCRFAVVSIVKPTNMELHYAKFWLGWLFLSSRIVALFLIILFRATGFYNNITIDIALGSLLLSTDHIRTVITYFIQNKYPKLEEHQAINPDYFYMVFILFSLFELAVLLILTIQALRPESIETFSILLFLTESFFISFVNPVFKDLFSSREAG